MKVGILAGGRGERLSEETHLRPKPMVTIGGAPLLWHIMFHYAAYDHREFVIALGYLGDVVRDWCAEMANNRGGTYRAYGNGHAEVHLKRPDWIIHLVETGPETNTGGRIKALGPWLGDNTFFLTWGDGVSDVDLDALYAFHQDHGQPATLTAVHPPPRFGHLVLDGNRVMSFQEKPKGAEGWINGAFFVLDPEVLDRIAGPDTAFEGEPMQSLAADGALRAYRHEGFWHCVDTLSDKARLEALWAAGTTPWIPRNVEDWE